MLGWILAAFIYIALTLVLAYMGKDSFGDWLHSLLMVLAAQAITALLVAAIAIATYLIGAGI